MLNKEMLYHMKRPFRKDELEQLNEAELMDFPEEFYRFYLWCMDNDFKISRTDNPLKPMLVWDEGFIEAEIDINTLQNSKMKMIELEAKREAINECLDTDDFRKLFVLIDDSMRGIIFDKCQQKIPKEDQAQVLIDIYTSGDYALNSLDRNELVKALKQQETRSWEDGLKISSGDNLIIYRGVGERSLSLKTALSWTTDESVAKFFATRLSDNGIVYKATVNVSDVLLFIDHEKEVLIEYKNVRVLDKIRI